MTPRLPILLPILGGVMATVVALELRALHPYALVLGLIGYVGFGLVVAFLVGWPAVEVSDE